MTECNSNKIGLLHSIETFGLVDGPGVRFVAFLQGCNMRCQFCHNADTWSLDNPGAKKVTADELLQTALRYKKYWGKKGGITVSGGDPMVQAEFVTELFAKAKALGINTCLDTSGQPFTREEPEMAKFKALFDVTDLVMLDIKEINEEKHKKLTGHSNQNILDMARWLSENGKRMWIRHVLVPGISDCDEDLEETAKFIETLETVERVEVLPYHTFGSYKWESLGYDYPLKDVEPPTKERVENARRILNAF